MFAELVLYISAINCVCVLTLALGSAGLRLCWPMEVLLLFLITVLCGVSWAAWIREGGGKNVHPILKMSGNRSSVKTVPGGHHY